jgi:hypothetical protein
MATVSLAQGPVASPSTDNKDYNRSELRQLVREAHTPAQYHALADYYAHQDASYQQKAAEEKQEWERRSMNVSGPAAKPPRPADSAKNLYEYYVWEADHASSLASQYRQLEFSSKLAVRP